MTALTPAQRAYRKLDSAQVARAVEFARTGAMNDDIAALIGVARSGFYRWMADGRAESERRFLGHEPDPSLDLVVDLWDGIRQAHAGIIAIASGSWVQAARNDWRAAEALLKTRFAHWRPAGVGLPAEGAGTVDDAADLADARLSEAQANAIVGAMRRFGESLLEAVIAAGSGVTVEDVDDAKRSMGALARAALDG